jgi:Uri superfamily endonuclease
MLQTTSNGIPYSEHEIVQAVSSHPGKLSRLFNKLRRPNWHVDYFFQKPRRAIDRELQERWPTDSV